MTTEIFQRRELVEFMVRRNKAEFNHLKAVEEANEFAEALVKHMTKSVLNPKRPIAGDILNEFGDLILRGLVSLTTLFHTTGVDVTLEDVIEGIELHIASKLERLEGWKKTGAYSNGL